MANRETVNLRITLTDPTPGVLFSLQDKDNQLSSVTESTGQNISFTLTVERDAAGRIYGKFVMGPPTGRFVYICSGTYAGQRGTPWSRRAKITLMTLPAAGTEFATRINGRSKDGGPACATVPLLDGGWRSGV